MLEEDLKELDLYVVLEEFIMIEDIEKLEIIEEKVNSCYSD